MGRGTAGHKFELTIESDVGNSRGAIEWKSEKEKKVGTCIIKKNNDK